MIDQISIWNGVKLILATFPEFLHYTYSCQMVWIRQHLFEDYLSYRQAVEWFQKSNG